METQHLLGSKGKWPHRCYSSHVDQTNARPTTRGRLGGHSQPTPSSAMCIYMFVLHLWIFKPQNTWENASVLTLSVIIPQIVLYSSYFPSLVFFFFFLVIWRGLKVYGRLWDFVKDFGIHGGLGIQPEGTEGCILRSAILCNLAYIYWKQWERERSM